MLTHSYRCHDCGFEGMVVLEMDVDADSEGGIALDTPAPDD